MLPIIMLAAALANTAAASSHRSAGADDTLSVRVSYRDLDLSRPKDLAKFNHRLREAAIDVCPNLYATSLLIPVEILRCRNLALAAARPQIAVAVGSATRLAANDGGVPPVPGEARGR